MFWLGNASGLPERGGGCTFIFSFEGVEWRLSAMGRTGGYKPPLRVMARRREPLRSKIWQNFAKIATVEENQVLDEEYQEQNNEVLANREEI